MARPIDTPGWGTWSRVVTTIAGAVVASSVLGAPSAAADAGITSFTRSASASVVAVGPSGEQSVVPVVRLVITLPWRTATVGTIVIAGVRQPDELSRAGVTMRFRPVCHLTAECVQVGNQLTVSFRMKLGGYDDDGLFGDNAAAALEHPGTFTFLPAVALRSGLSIPYTGKPITVRFVRATRIARFNASPEPVRPGSRVRVTGVVSNATACPEGTRTAACRQGQPGRWAPIRGRRVAVYFDPAGPAPVRLVATARSDLSGRFTRTFRQRVTGVWYARLAATPLLGPSRSGSDRVRVRR